MSKNNGHRMLILAGDTNGNIGDRAIVAAMCREFMRMNANLRISILSSDPANDRKYFVTDTIPRGIKGLGPLLRIARRSDVILCGGGGLFQDDDSLVKMPYWCVRIVILKLINPKARFLAYALGVGPLRNRFSRMCARIAFGCMDVISVRDPRARETALKLTGKKVHLVPDPALHLPRAPDNEAENLLRRHHVPMGKKLVGVSLRRNFHLKGSLIPHKFAFKYKLRPIPGDDECNHMINLVAGALDFLAERHDAHILFLPTYNVAHEADDNICRRVMETMHSSQKSIARIDDPMLYKAVAGHLSGMLGGRMHPTILSASAGTNIIGLSYNPKFEGFFELMGITEKVIKVNDLVRNRKQGELVRLLVEAIFEDDSIKGRAARLAGMTFTFNREILFPLFFEAEKD